MKRETKTYPQLHCKYCSPLLSTAANVKQWHVQIDQPSSAACWADGSAMEYVQLCKSGIKVCQPVSATSLPIQAIFCFYCCTYINQACEKWESQHSSLRVCLPHVCPSSWPQLLLAGRGFVLPSRQTLCVCWNQLSFTHVPVREQNRGLYLEALILFSHLVYKCIVQLTLFLMIFKLWRDPGP